MSKNKGVNKIPSWIAWVGSIVAILAIVSVIADGCSLLDRLSPGDTPVPHDEITIEDSEAIVIGGDVISSSVEISHPLPESTKDTRLYNVQIEGQNHNVIVAYNQTREPLWQTELDTRIRDVILDDIDQDGSLEILAATHEPGPRPGWLLAFDQMGNLVCEHDTWKQPIYYGGAKPQMNIADFEVVDLTGDGTKEVVVASQDVYWYASRLSVLRFQDKGLVEMAEYWNPGLLNTIHIADTNNDGVQEIIGICENNDLQSVFALEGNVFAVFLLDGARISGQAPPGFGNAPEGSEIWYGYAAPASVSIREVGFEDTDGNGVLEVHVSLSDHCSYYLDYEGNIVRRGMGTGCTDDSDLRILQ